MRRIAALLVLLVAMSACEVTNSDPVLTLYVAPNTVDCVGLAPQACLLVKADADDEWTYFYNDIEGFTYEPGYAYVLRVERRYIPNPPADGSNYEYRLLRVVSRKSAT